MLRRYTDLPALLEILNKKQITLLSPSSWDDRNDRYLMDAYKSKNKLKTLLALCFSLTDDTYHHWKVFSPGNSGVCIEFYKSKLTTKISGNGFIHSNITYKKISDLKKPIPEKDLPFIKRYAFRDEAEYRIIYQSNIEKLETKPIKIDMNAINRIIINPWIPDSLFESIKQTIGNIPDCKGIGVIQSKVIDSPSWKRFSDNYTP